MARKRKQAIPLFILLLLACMIGLSACSEDQVYETDDLSCYGQFPDDKNAEAAQEQLEHWFPVEIDPRWEKVAYHYKSVDSIADVYSFEIELEFQIPDHNDYLSFQQEMLNRGLSCAFPFVEDATICFFEAPIFLLETPECRDCKNQPPHYHIGWSTLQSVILNESTQSAYLISLSVYDGGGASTYDYPTFFERFSIDPVKFSEFTEAFRCEHYSPIGEPLDDGKANTRGAL